MKEKMIETIVEKPLRIDLAGGWSDTPPICNELGGCVLNVAVTLNGVKPVKAQVRRLDEKKVVVESVDLRKKGVYTSDREIADHSDPHDWGCLIKSALTVVGYKLKEGGLSIRISADVPKGSGMGTSSILGAALVEALGKVLDRESRLLDYRYRKVRWTNIYDKSVYDCEFCFAHEGVVAKEDLILKLSSSGWNRRKNLHAKIGLGVDSLSPVDKVAAKIFVGEKEVSTIELNAMQPQVYDIVIPHEALEADDYRLSVSINDAEQCGSVVVLVGLVTMQ